MILIYTLFVISLAFSGLSVVGQVELPHFCGAFLAGSWFVFCSRNKQHMYCKSPLDASLLGLVFWGILTLFWSPSLFMGVNQAIRLLYGIIIYFVSFSTLVSGSHDRKAMLRRAAFAWVLVGLVNSLLVICNVDVGSFDGGIPLSKEALRSAGLTFHPNEATGVCMFTTLICLCVLLSSKFGVTWLCAAFTGCLSLACLLRTGGRVGLVLTGGSILLFLFFSGKTSRRMLPVVAGPLLLITGLYFSVAPDLWEVAQQRASSITPTGLNEAADVRLSLWSIAFDRFIETWGVGTGLGGLQDILFQAQQGDRLLAHPHNLYLYTLCEFGFIGFMCLLAIIALAVLTFRKALLQSRDPAIQLLLRATCVGLFAHLLWSVVDWDLTNVRVWAFLGLAVACAKIAMLEHDEAGDVG